MFMAILVGVIVKPDDVQAGTTAQKKAFEEELTKMLYDVDTTTHDVYKYSITTSEMTAITNKMKSDSCRLIWYSYYSNMYFNYTTKSGKISKVNIANADSDVLKRYATLKKNVESIEAGIKSGMTDLDKVIYIHDRIVEICTYKYVAYQSYGACGVLGDQVGVCAGYTKAMIMLLEHQGIEAIYISNPSINHGWPLVKIDGQWYHIDPTWDDTRSSIKGKTSHAFLLKNDSEFNSNGHAGWPALGDSYTSTSTKFKNWFVQKITGEMLYENGYWYYYDKTSSSIKKAKSTGEGKSTVIDNVSGSSITLTAVNNGVVSFIVDGTKYTSDSYSSKNEEVSIDTTSADDHFKLSLVKNSSEDLSDFSLWKTGHYNLSTGAYDKSQTARICINDYIPVIPDAEYTISITNNEYKLIINQMDSNNKLISRTLHENNSVLTTHPNCTQISVSLYCYISSKEYSLTYDKYSLLFSDGLNIKISANSMLVQEENSDSTTSTNTSSSLTKKSINLCDFGLWQIGHYNLTDGNYDSKQKYRICVKDSIPVITDTEYTVELDNPEYSLIINQMDENNKLISRKVVANNETFITSSNCNTITVSMYCPIKGKEYTVSIDDYTSLFNNNINVQITYYSDDQTSTENEISSKDSQSNDSQIDDSQIDDSEIDDSQIEETETESTEIEEAITPNDNQNLAETNTEYIDLSNLKLWVTGEYRYNDAKFVAESEHRLALKDTVAVLPNTEYAIKYNSSSSKEYRIIINQLDSSGKLITRANYANNDTFKTSSNCKALSICLYCPTRGVEYTLKYSDFEELFSSKLELGLFLTYTIDDVDTPTSALVQEENMYPIYITLISLVVILLVLSIVRKRVH